MEFQPEPTLIEFIRYNNWANAQILAVCQKLTAEQLAASAPGTYGTIHATLAHIIKAETSYIRRLTGSRPEAPFKWEDRPALSDIAAFAPQVAQAMLDAVGSTPPQQIVHEEENGHTYDYQARALFIQVINHGIEHRTNVTTILSGLGLPEMEIDGWGYLSAHEAEFEVKQT